MYPRPGRPLLPRALESGLGGHCVRPEVAERLGLPDSTTLGDLTEDVWLVHGPDAIKSLASEVVAAIDASVLEDIAHLLVFTDRPSIDALDIAARTANALIRGGHVEEGRLRPTRVGDLVEIRQFGARALLDVLSATDPAVDGPRDEAEGARPSPAVRAAAGQLARKRWAAMLSSDDPRVGGAITALHPSAKTAREAAEAVAEQLYTPAEGKRMAGALRRLVGDLDTMRRLSLEQEAKELVDALTDRAASRPALLARTGLAGTAPTTLKVAGELIGVTRERVRQIERKFRERVTDSRVWTPVLDRALEVAAQTVPALASEVEASLREQGVVEGDFSVDSLVAAAQLFGKNLTFDVVDGLLLPVGEWASPVDIRYGAHRLVEHWGVTTFADVETRLREDGGDVHPEIVRLAVETMEGFMRLDHERGWFWIEGTRNRLLNQVDKIMSVAGSISLSDLRRGVGRHHRMNGFRPPREVLATLCTQTGRYGRVGDVILGVDLPDWRDLLGRNERVLVETLFEHGPVMRRDDLVAIVIGERGLNRSSLEVYLGYSPLIERFAPGVYGLRGASVTAAEVDALIPPRVRHQVLQDHGWTDDGELWVAYKISPASEATGVVGTPAAIRAVASGSFPLFDDEGDPVGNLVVEDNTWGLSPSFRRWGVEAGDHVVLSLDLEARTATISAGTEELLLRFQGGE